MPNDLLNHKIKCRLCFQRISVSRNTSKVTENVQQKFFKLTNIELKLSDKFSNAICKICIKSLHESSEFQCKMIDNQRRLYAFEGEAETAKVKQEQLETRFDEVLDMQIKTEVFDIEMVQMDASAPVELEQDFSDMNQDQIEDSFAAGENFQASEDSAPPAESIKVRKKMNYSLEQLNDALETVRKEQTSARSAAKRFGVPHTTLTRKLNKKEFVTHGKCIFLTEEEELQVRVFIKKRSESCIQTTNEDIVNCAVRILKKRKRNCSLAVSTLSTRWVASFRDRQAHFSEFQIDEGFTHTCDLCNFSTLKKKDMRIHANFHLGKTSERAPHAKRKKYTKADLEAAARLVTDESMSKAAAARLFGVPRFTLTKHLLRKERNNDDDKPKEVHKCSYCDQIFFSYWMMRAHTKNHLAPVGEFKCEECGKVYSTLTKLKQHQLHHKPGEYRCNRCNLVFDMLLDAQKHHRIHRPIVPCEICGKLVNKGKSYTHHFRSHGEPQFKCPFEECSKVYKLKAGLDYHIENVHTPKQNVKCPKCDSTFPNATRLKRHDERSHGEARFFCEVDGCNYKNTRKEYLKLHLRNHKDIDSRTRSELIANVRVQKADK